ncbi:MAG: hypothetical protein JSS61_03810 [Verrucomicrobia bacterium]|nr:hypothetical protein [Verrucomicrobiota bacterium]
MVKHTALALSSLLSLLSCPIEANVTLPSEIYLPTTTFETSFPYITGDAIRSICDHVFDPTRALDPKTVHLGDTVFLFFDYLDYFFAEIHPLIPEPYILVTHHFYDSSDDPVPGKFGKYLEDEKVLGWFSHNLDREHRKLHPLPIGIANACYEWGERAIFDECIATYRNQVPKTGLLYMNFYTHTCPGEREWVKAYFEQKPFCTKPPRQSLRPYLIDVAHHKFVLSPRGHGLDCFRTWETLLMGSFPIVRASTLDPLFVDLPVLIIENWEEVTEEFLQTKYEELAGKDHNWNKLYMPYWIDQIHNLQTKSRATPPLK